MAVFQSKSGSKPGSHLDAVRGVMIMDFEPQTSVANLFTIDDQHSAMAEGWFVGKDNETGMYAILDNLTLTFSTPSEARAWVVKRADEGSDLHERALAATVVLTIRNAGKA